jgi:hypothetical protein
MVRLELMPQSSRWKALSTLKIEGAGSFETFVIPSTRFYIPDDGNVESHRCEDFKSDSTFGLGAEITWELQRDY